MSALSDLAQFWGTDLAVTVSGDLATVTALPRLQQRLLRRLLTNPGAYWWQPDYGAGLRQFIGGVGKTADIEALIVAQCQLEDGVSGVSVAVQYIAGGISVSIAFLDTETNQQSLLNFSVTE